ncbi:UNVERIFIED_CONTAM: hypothetical protein NCL1_60479 [Trichonephila clavipes]
MPIQSRKRIRASELLSDSCYCKTVERISRKRQISRPVEEITDFVQVIPECDEDVETWMACDAKDCGFQMLNDDEIVTSIQEDSDSVDMKRMKTRTTTTKVVRGYQMLTLFLC